MSKTRGYLARAKQCELHARKARTSEEREWKLTLARAYRMLAEAENEAVTTRRLPSAA